MRKIILALILITGTVKAQQYISVTVTNVTDTISQGDSLKINFKVNGTGGLNGYISLWTPAYTYTCYSFQQINLQNLPQDPDNSYWIKVKPNSALGTGSVKVVSNATPSPGWLLTYIKSPVGIEELSKYQNKEKTYYDLMGNQIEARTNELIIEQIGNHRRKIYITE